MSTTTAVIIMVIFLIIDIVFAILIASEVRNFNYAVTNENTFCPTYMCKAPNLDSSLGVPDHRPWRYKDGKVMYKNLTSDALYQTPSI